MLIILVVGILFFLSLLGAVILFKFFKSSAIVKNKQYQAGGAIGGFIIIFLLLSTSYYELEKTKNDSLMKKLEETTARLESINLKLQLLSIEGKINPSFQDAKVVLSVKETEADISGRFKFSMNCIDPEVDDVKIYVQREGKYIPYRITSKKDMTGININIP